MKIACAWFSAFTGGIQLTNHIDLVTLSVHCFLWIFFAVSPLICRRLIDIERSWFIMYPVCMNALFLAIKSFDVVSRYILDNYVIFKKRPVTEPPGPASCEYECSIMNDHEDDSPSDLAEAAEQQERCSLPATLGETKGYLDPRKVKSEVMIFQQDSECDSSEFEDDRSLYNDQQDTRSETPQQNMSNSPSPETSPCRPVKDKESFSSVLERSIDTSGPRFHYAKSQDDTTDGATHWFFDEEGNIMIYTFGERSSGVAESLPAESSSNRWSRRHSCPSNQDEASVLWRQPHVTTNRFTVAAVEDDMSLFRVLENADDTASSGRTTGEQTRELLRGERRLGFLRLPPVFKRSASLQTMKLGKFSCLFPFDHIWLSGFSDRNTWPDMVMSMLSLNLTLVMVYCLYTRRNLIGIEDCAALGFVLAGCHFSLLKAPNPDSFTPQHGISKQARHCRSAHFILIGLLLLLMDYWSSDDVQLRETDLVLFGFKINTQFFSYFRYLFKVVLLWLPVAFTLGMVSQISNVLVCLLEFIQLYVFASGAIDRIWIALCKFSINVAALFLFSVGYKMSLVMSVWIRSAVIAAIVFTILTVNRLSELLRLTRSKRTVFKSERKRSQIRWIFLESVLIFGFVAMTSFLVNVVLTETELSELENRYYFGILSGTMLLGGIVYYLLPEMSVQHPFSLFLHPFLKQSYYGKLDIAELSYGVHDYFYICLTWADRYLVQPIVFVWMLNTSHAFVIEKFGTTLGSFLLIMCSWKFLASAMTDSRRHFYTCVITLLATRYDWRAYSESILINYLAINFIILKMISLYEKISFLSLMILLWQCHSLLNAFSYPLFTPHTLLLLCQAVFTSLIGAPLAPLFDSAIFLASYIRPVKFWPKNFTSKIGSEPDKLSDTNFYMMLYQKLTDSLEENLCKECEYGRLGNISSKDFLFFLSDRLNCLIQIIHRGHNSLTFQLRGLELTGTPCQQEELHRLLDHSGDVLSRPNWPVYKGTNRLIAALCSSVQRFKFCDPVTVRNMKLRSWRVVSSLFPVKSYVFTEENLNDSMSAFDQCQMLVSFVIKAVIYHSLLPENWATLSENEEVMQVITKVSPPGYVARSFGVSHYYDEDYCDRFNGITLESFLKVYGDWIKTCARRKKTTHEDNNVICFVLAILSRRLLYSIRTIRSWGPQSALGHHQVLLAGFHTLFHNNVKEDELKLNWGLTNMNLVSQVLAPACRLAIKLNHENFVSMDDWENLEAFYDDIEDFLKTTVIVPTTDPLWGQSIMSDAPSLMSMRKSETFNVLTMNTRYISFKIVKVNPESVLSFWAGQQQEQIFFRTRHKERGSIQEAGSVLRNMINSSGDPPIGYPLYVSSIRTSVYCPLMNIVNCVPVCQALRTWIDRATSLFQGLFRFPMNRMAERASKCKRVEMVALQNRKRDTGRGPDVVSTAHESAKIDETDAHVEIPLLPSGRFSVTKNES